MRYLPVAAVGYRERYACSVEVQDDRDPSRRMTNDVTYKLAIDLREGTGT